MPALKGAGLASRRVAADVLARVEQGAWANAALDAALARTTLSGPDRALATALVFGTLRRQRACDWLVDEALRREVELPVRIALRLGAYQLVFLGQPAYAAVSTAVATAPRRAAGLVNAVLRRIAAGDAVSWPSPAVELSYPDWIVERLFEDLGEPDALGALGAMNEPGAAAIGAGGTHQDLASQWVAAAVPHPAGGIVVDLCAAPGGKAVAVGAGPSLVAAVERRPGRARRLARRVRRDDGALAVLVADGRFPPLRPGFADCVLVDAPCSGLGALRRRPDARWRLDPGAPARLSQLQRELLEGSVGLLRPGGTLVYSVCTLTRVETEGVDAWIADRFPSLRPLPRLGPPWQQRGRGEILLPQTAGTDGMFLLRVALPG